MTDTGWFPWGEDLRDPRSRSHLFRYVLARGVIEKDDLVVDAACGMGAGSAFLARHCRHLFGIDISPNAINQARQKFGTIGNLSFIEADLDRTELPSCDVAVSIETIEHLVDPERFAKELRRAARKFIVVSAPIIHCLPHPFHKHEFNEQSFKKLMVGDGWDWWGYFGQGHLPAAPGNTINGTYLVGILARW